MRKLVDQGRQTACGLARVLGSQEMQAAGTALVLDMVLGVDMGLVLGLVLGLKLNTSRRRHMKGPVERMAGKMAGKMVGKEAGIAMMVAEMMAEGPVADTSTMIMGAQRAAWPIGDSGQHTGKERIGMQMADTGEGVSRATVACHLRKKKEKKLFYC